MMSLNPVEESQTPTSSSIPQLDVSTKKLVKCLQYLARLTTQQDQTDVHPQAARLIPSTFHPDPLRTVLSVRRRPPSIAAKPFTVAPLCQYPIGWDPKVGWREGDFVITARHARADFGSFARRRGSDAAFGSREKQV
jgi:hypothetical protein